MRRLRDLWDDDPETLALFVGAASVILIAMVAAYYSEPPHDPVPVPAVEIVPEPHVLTQSYLRWNLLDRWPAAAEGEEATVEKAALEEEDPPMRRRRHRHWRRW